MRGICFEIKRLFKNFFKKVEYFKELECPRELRRFGMKLGAVELFQLVLSFAFSLTLRATNMFIEKRMIIFGIIVFLFSKLQPLAMSIFNDYTSNKKAMCDVLFQDLKIIKGAAIVGKTSNRIYKYNESKKAYELMPNEVALNSLSRYMDNLWKYQINLLFNIFSILSIIGMLVISVYTNTKINNLTYIVMLIVFVLINMIVFVNQNLNYQKYYKEERVFSDEQEVLKNDLLRVPNIVEKDIDMRISRFKSLLLKNKNNTGKYIQKRNKTNLFGSFFEILGEYLVIILYISAIDWRNMTIATIAEITAGLIIYQTAISKVKNIFKSMENVNAQVIAMEAEHETINAILNCLKENNRESKEINEISIEPFEIKYLEMSENDKPFTLVSKERIVLKRGDVAILYGPSGSGKSTFMKMLTERIRIEKSVDIPSTDRFLFFDESLKFGSLPIFDELFLESEPDYEKMSFILSELGLWSEISRSCSDVWQWMKEKHFTDSLSNGQKQRMILAKILYWLDEKHDVLVLDEATSGLDEKSSEELVDAQKILSFVVRYANHDKGRIVIIATHQEIEEFKQAIQYNIREFTFSRFGDCNFVNEEK